eukprot:m.97114 g.97114  ORF g.97114 m.97114 type:complete len:755 (-) comp13966_c0_seq2:108-2372(-)
MKNSKVSNALPMPCPFVAYRSLFLSLVALSFLASPHVYAQLPLGFVTTALGDAGTGETLMDVTFLPLGGAVLLVGRAGLINVALVDGDALQIAPYLDLSSVVFFEGETGVFDLELDPGFPTSPYVYVSYTRNNVSGPKQTDLGSSIRISRFTHSGTGLESRAALSSEVVLWRANTGYPAALDGFDYPHHYGGGLSFGPDGLLYMAFGDQAADPESGKLSPAQQASSDSGCIIRITKTGAYPPGNLARGCFAKGVRNGFKAHWDLPSGMLFIGDVGSNICESYEEINVLTFKSTKTSNFAWPRCEGYCGNPVYPDCPCNASNPFLAPWFAYKRPSCDVGAAVVGGTRYRGASFPSSYHGALFFGDYALNRITLLYLNVNNKPVLPLRYFSDANAITSMTFSPEGDLYFGDWYGYLTRISFNPDILTEPLCSHYGCGNSGADQSCACDEACVGIGDCCEDYSDTCVPKTTLAPATTLPPPTTFPLTGTVVETNWDIFVSTPTTPLKLTLTAGDTLRFHYTDTLYHTVVDRAQSGVLLCPLAVQPFVCDVPMTTTGVFTLACGLHPAMFVIVTVVEPSGPPSLFLNDSSRVFPSPAAAITATLTQYLSPSPAQTSIFPRTRSISTKVKKDPTSEPHNSTQVKTTAGTRFPPTLTATTSTQTVRKTKTGSSSRSTTASKATRLTTKTTTTARKVLSTVGSTTRPVSRTTARKIATTSTPKPSRTSTKATTSASRGAATKQSTQSTRAAAAPTTKKKSK